MSSPKDLGGALRHVAKEQLLQLVLSSLERETETRIVDIAQDQLDRLARPA